VFVCKLRCSKDDLHYIFQERGACLCSFKLACQLRNRQSRMKANGSYFPSQNEAHRVFAIKRLIADLKEVKEHPLANVCALPVHDNLFEWHGNLQGNRSILHFILRFSADYPLHPPRIQICTQLDHPNVESVNEHSSICLDLLDNLTHSQVCLLSLCAITNRGLNAKPYQGWSSAYSVQSLLMQLSIFLHDSEGWY